MAIKINTAPQKSVDAFNQAMEWFAQNKKPAGKARALIAEHKGAQNTPHRIYNMQRDEIIAGKGLEAAKMAGWRYMFTDDENHYHVAEVSGTDAGNEHHFSHFNEGSHVDNFMSAFSKLGQESHVKSKDYEMAILRVPACYVLAIWLKTGSHKDDILIPIEPVHEGFEAGKSYTAADFMTRLKTIATEMAKVKDRDEK